MCFEDSHTESNEYVCTQRQKKEIDASDQYENDTATQNPNGIKEEMQVGKSGREVRS